MFLLCRGLHLILNSMTFFEGQVFIKKITSSQLTLLRKNMLRRVISCQGRISARRSFGTSVKEVELQEKVESALGEHTKCVATDTSGGCGSFYVVKVISPKFVGLTRVEQNRLVHSVLKEDIATMHGINVSTAPPPKQA